MKYLLVLFLCCIACQQNNDRVSFYLDKDFHGWLYLVKANIPENRIEKISNNLYKVNTKSFDKIDSATFYLGDLKLMHNDLKYVNRALYSPKQTEANKMVSTSEMVSVIEIYIPKMEEWNYPDDYWADREIRRKYRMGANIIDSIINAIK